MAGTLFGFRKTEVADSEFMSQKVNFDAKINDESKPKVTKTKQVLSKIFNNKDKQDRKMSAKVHPASKKL